jgi:hypothetical protein
VLVRSLRHRLAAWIDHESGEGAQGPDRSRRARCLECDTDPVGRIGRSVGGYDARNLNGTDLPAASLVLRTLEAVVRVPAGWTEGELA